VTLFEAENSSGGKIKSFYEDGFIWEKGPNTMVKQFIYKRSPLEVKSLFLSSSSSSSYSSHP
jgi:protoporphyrinogen oxidase